MILNLIYDAFALAAPQSFRDGMATAASILMGAIYDNITINIGVGYGEYNNGPLFLNQNISLGGDSSFGITYSNLRALLVSHETSAADVTSVNALPNTTTLNGQSSFVIGTAEARALGALPANNGTVDGLVGMGTNFTGSVLIGGALHELTHAMGRVPGASGLSLFRYTSQGNHLFAGGTPAAASYFSIDGGVTKLADFGVSSDPSDFLNSPASNLTPNDPFDEGIAGSTLTSVDLTMMDVLGFNVTSSPPQYVFFAPGQPMNAVTTTDPNNVPPPAPGNFNLEVVVNATGTGSFATAPGDQGLAVRSTDGHTLTMLHGDYGAVDNGAGNTIFLGDGSESIGGAIGDTIIGGNGANQFLDGHLGHQSITGGSAGNETIWGALTDTVRGGSGGNETIGGVAGETIFGSSGANVFINATGGNQSVRGGSAGNDSVWTAAGDTIHGGGNNATVGGVAGVTMVGGTGGNQFFDASQGHQSVLGGSGGNETIWGAATDTITGGNGGNETIGGVSGETILGGSGANIFVAAMNGNMSVVGGSAGNMTVWAGAGDTIRGGSDNETIGGVPNDTVIGGNGGNQFIDGSQGHQSILGGSGGNETIWGAATDTITGGSAGNETIGGVAGESVTGGAANTVIDASAGSQWIALGGGNSTVSGGAHDTILGSSGSGSAHIVFAGGNESLWDNGSTTSGHDSVTNFSQAAGDRVSLTSATDTVSAVLASATSDLGGNVVLHLQDNSSITLVGVTPLMLNSGFFTTH